MFLFTFNYWGRQHCAVCNESSLEKLSDVPPIAYEELASISIEKYLTGWGIWRNGEKPKDVKAYEVKEIHSRPIFSVMELDLTIPLSKS